MTPNDFLAASLEFVESKSIREWARTEKNGPIWLAIAESTLKNHDGYYDPKLFAAYIVSVAIGA